MQHDEHTTSHTSPGFGKNTNGLGIFIIVILFVVFGLFSWNLWNNEHAYDKHYRIEASAEHATGHDAAHEHEGTHDTDHDQKPAEATEAAPVKAEGHEGEHQVEVKH